MKPTADIYDIFSEQLQVAAPLFRDFGGRLQFSGPVLTLKVFEDNSFVRAALEEPGDGRILIVDGGGSLRCALLGDQLAELGVRNGWNGIIVYGCVRDSQSLAELDIGIKALATNPRKSVKRNLGERDVGVRFAEVEFKPGDYVYADPDGILISETPLVEV
jgi:regulator of ribonuclease activity A